MKTIGKSLSCIVFILAFLISGNKAFATVITVSNNPVDSAAAMYSNLQAALDAASSGDTIYVSGSPTSYGDIIITKQLTLIGAGYNPNNQFGHASQLGTVTLATAGLPTPSSSSGTFITGFIVYKITDIWNISIDNITISRNRIVELYIESDPGYPESGWSIVNNFFTYFTGGQKLDGSYSAFNILIANNIFDGASLIGFSQASVLITNNLFLNKNPAIGGLSNSIITNNIFYGAGVGSNSDNADYCTFNNNISYGGATTSFDYGTNSSAGNLEDTSPQFVSVSGAAFDYSYDYHLQGTSPGINAGTDGSDIGLYGGTYSFPSGGDVPWQTSPMPAIPQIMQMDVLNSVLPADSTLRIHIKARKQK